jgi:hypothetical protein
MLDEESGPKRNGGKYVMIANSSPMIFIDYTDDFTFLSLPLPVPDPGSGCEAFLLGKEKKQRMPHKIIPKTTD